MRTPVVGGDGWVRGLRRVDSPNFGPRPAGTAIDLVVVHSISLPPGSYGGDAIDRLFTNTLDCDAHPYYDALRGLQVSAHFVVARGGAATQYVSVDGRAWHAGASSWRGRPNCNDYSVGIEMEGLEGEAFETAQYVTLCALLRTLRQRHPIACVVGHEHVAPGRKRDPGTGFDWVLLRRRLRWPRTFFA